MKSGRDSHRIYRWKYLELDVLGKIDYFVSARYSPLQQSSFMMLGTLNLFAFNLYAAPCVERDCLVPTTGRHTEPRKTPKCCPAVCKSCLRIFCGILVVTLRKHWESTSVIGCSVFVVNHDWLQLHSKMAEVLTQSVTQVVFLPSRNIKVALCLELKFGI